METITITLPSELCDFVEQQVVRRGLTSPSDFFQELLDHERQAVDAQERLMANKARLEELLLEGLDSGQPEDATDEWWNLKERMLMDRLDRRQPT